MSRYTLAFRADNQQQVNAFYQAVIVAYGSDNGKPWSAPKYYLHYYGAFVFNSDGHNIEAACHSLEAGCKNNLRVMRLLKM